jgi:hypothetical protein
MIKKIKKIKKIYINVPNRYGHVVWMMNGNARATTK